VANGKTVTLAGASLSGADAGNYVLDSVANITALHITGSFTASSKVYDGNNPAAVLTRSLLGAIRPRFPGSIARPASLTCSNSTPGLTHSRSVRLRRRNHRDACG
jgi:hypothetical protein